MAIVSLDQYLMSILRTKRKENNEIRLSTNNQDFNLFTIYLENNNLISHYYTNDMTIILYVVSGRAIIKSNGRSLNLQAGNIIILTAGCKYLIQLQNSDTILVKLKFKSNFVYQEFFNDMANSGIQENNIIKKVINKLQIGHILWFKNKRFSQADEIMQQIINNYLNQEVFATACINAEFTLMIILLLKTQQLFMPINLDEPKFEGNLLDEYIEHHFKDITLAETAKHFGFNPNYFSNMVKQKTGKGFIEHVDERRMQEAQILLAKPNISLKEIINKVGYSSKSFFYKKFNQYYGETPISVRKKLFEQENINLQ